MIRILTALFLLVVLSLPAGAVEIDPEGEIRADLLARALAAQQDHAAELRDTGRLVIVDYAQHSASERLYVVNLETGNVTAYRAAHGRGSDRDHDGYLDTFSDVSGSSASPEGAFALAEEYVGQHGRSLRLDGLDAGNRSSRARAIVIHAAAYAEPDFLARYGKLGRSNGCIVFSKADLKRFLADVPKGTLMFVSK
ncbi:murein L,D-transpeptidase catalytic domain-containing protein [Hyphomonas johnsonii]|uniref:YkuD domain-containing protein n=1 Tax=Hyphomonas johnsonii MHS-2 TaxID=1280950 RepID=A0A059FU72_9PROT|nr:murein L,D-transpeptidase catalytic domain family protein [Hyphomonas johnsonii]KCZ94152.1 hypothetical protein HJO_02215 [Hyphomonas johnsonii MHS-2]